MVCGRLGDPWQYVVFLRQIAHHSNHLLCPSHLRALLSNQVLPPREFVTDPKIMITYETKLEHIRAFCSDV